MVACGSTRRWPDYLPVEFATEFAEEFQRVLRAGPAALAAPVDAP
jgi:hypothetical protein